MRRQRLRRDVAAPSSSRAMAAASLPSKRELSTFTPGIWPDASAVAKFMRPSRLAVLSQASPVFGIAGRLQFAVERLAQIGDRLRQA